MTSTMLALVFLHLVHISSLLSFIARSKEVHYYSVFHVDTHAWDTGSKSAVQLVQSGYGKQDSFPSLLVVVCVMGTPRKPVTGVLV